jgi:glycosyltransferase involved in cell wall biosynthesis
MKIGISGYYLLNPTSGFGRSIVALLPSLAKKDKENHYVVLVPQKIEARMPANFEIEVIPESINFLGTSFARFWWDHILLPNAAFKAGVDLLHYPYPTLPFFKSKMPLVVSINNIIYWKFKEYRSGLWTKLRQFFKKEGFKKGAKIIVPSIATKMDIINTFHIPSEKIAIIPYGKNPIFKKGITSSQTAVVKKRYNINGPFILYVGSFDFRKNLKRLIRSFAAVAKKRSELNLIIAGGISTVVSPFVFSFDEMALYASNHGVSDKVHFIRLVPTEDLLALYNLASTFVYPSLYEGFATAVIEAMACGCPVVASNTSCLPEVVGDAGILVDPYSEAELASAIEKAVSDYNLKRNLISKGLRQAEKFSWDQTADSTLQVYKEIVK